MYLSKSEECLYRLHQWQRGQTTNKRGIFLALWCEIKSGNEDDVAVI